MKNHFKTETRPETLKSNMVCGKNYRISVLTKELIRFEYSDDGVFEDRPTQLVLFRDFPKTKYTLKKTDKGITINTGVVEINYAEKPFSKKSLKVTLLSTGYVWYYGDESSNLKGTARTLDTVNGDNVILQDGILSKKGIAELFDDSGIAIKEDGWIDKREQHTDMYLFCYGHNYLKALKDFYYLCGKTPLIPRYALGNWWSRYYKYTQKEYLELMDKFKEKDIPLSVAVIDMDWHLVEEVDPKYGTGWTGFTWNTKLFPDHVAFLADLHSRGLKTTLNLHPHSGIRAFEKPYPVIAKHMGVDVENGEQVKMDVTDENFIRYYYEDVLNPLEDEGVDFWWVDWQQGTKTKFENLDPLWMFNHYGYKDSGRNGKRNITLSRFTDKGGHRYPIGFSGDTHVTWETLDFQPYFTVNASNIGYGWWSHDIGGHMQGYKDNELMTRWVQFAVFSPILRLHSTCNPFNSKEPWKYGYEAENIISNHLRLRHKLVPYLYNMNYESSFNDTPLLRPLYFVYPETEEAYEYKNEYFFGSDLIACPITSKRIQGTGLAKVDVYLPEGEWYDIFANRLYTGGRRLTLYRDLENIPVFAKTGSVIPTTDKIDALSVSSIPNQLHLYAYAGNNDECNMYEDDGETNKYLKGKFVKTRISFIGNSKSPSALTIEKPEGELSLLPKTRDYVIEFVSTKDATDKVHVYQNGKEIKFECEYDSELYRNIIRLSNVNPKEKLEIKFDESIYLRKNNLHKAVFDLLDKAEIRYETKTKMYGACFNNKNYWGIFNELSKLCSDYNLIAALIEILKSIEDDTCYFTE